MRINATMYIKNKAALARAPLDGTARAAYTSHNRRPRRPARKRWPAGFPFFRLGPARALILTLAAAWLSACGPSAATPSIAPPGAATTASPRANPSPIRASTLNSPNATASNPDATFAPGRTCRGAGRVVSAQLEADSLPRPLPYHVYLPPCYEQTGLDYPTLYLLHGLGADYEQWISLGLPQTAGELMASATVHPYLIVLPWQRTGLELEPALVEQLLPHIGSRYRTRAGRDWRAIGGLSRGAGWAFRVGFRHPDRFGAVGLHSPALMGGDLFAADRWLAAHPELQPPEVWIDIGDRDTLLPAIPELLDRLDELDVEYRYRLGSGWHDAEYWSQNLDLYLRWYGDRW